jgi:spore germination protein
LTNPLATAYPDGMKHILLYLTLFYSGLAVAAFDETWAYLYKGEERFFPAGAPITDIGCFSASVNGDGGLSGGHTSPPKLEGAHPDVRYHLVITIPWNNTLTHIYLDKELPLRDRIIDAILERCAPFDGVQIDFEAIDKGDRLAYIDFLATLRQKLPKDKIFSVAVMARWDAYMKANPDDVFDYRLISHFADRIIVMAYDEHYGGGSPGPIASLPWCQKVYAHAQKTIPANKLIMGIPLYGRSWQTPSHAKAHRYNQLQQLIVQTGSTPKKTEEEGGSFVYPVSTTVTTYFETIESLKAKIDLYRSAPCKGVACWRIGQEPDGFWNLLK